MKKLVKTFYIKSPEGEDIRVYLSVRHTSMRTTEYAEVLDDMGEVTKKGTYVWINRPWQRYDFEIALTNLCEKLGGKKNFEFYKKQIDMIHNDEDGFEEWFKNWSKSWNSDVSDDIKERTARALGDHAVTSMEEADSILRMAKAFTAMQKVLGDGGKGE